VIFENIHFLIFLGAKDTLDKELFNKKEIEQ